ncbi:response regulator [Tuberibacillus sp. Marseille-P3662]|uniref:response regulator n=1 Tax=Tuberibacillus sp. Marseille-P3662 TaxID=1965358 RepID=UPI000A1CA11C|nr:response regulator [Tuberibacillus sp. Marseille-P3662]
MIRVAIAEDDFRVASLHEQFLSSITNVSVVGQALNADQTLELLRNDDVDLLLLDIYMPDVFGTELLPEIRKSFPSVDIIMITAATEKDMLETSLRYGVFNYLIKPVKLERFKTAIEDYKRKKDWLVSHQELDQSVVDRYFGHANAGMPEKDQLPKGIDSLTLEKVKNILFNTVEGMTAEAMSEKMGASRTTARRYLEYLISTGEGQAELEYGIVGRPERKYFIYS